MPNKVLSCVSRYNISTAEYDGWDSAVNSSIARLRNIRVLDGDTENGEATLNPETISELSDVYERFGFSTEEAREVHESNFSYSTIKCFIGALQGTSSTACA